MQIWVRPYSQVSLHNVLCNEFTLMDQLGFELQILFEKGDRLNWIERLIINAFQVAEKQGYSIQSPVLTCLNTELFNQNWCQAVYGDRAAEEDAIAGLFLKTFSNSLGMPLQWLVDEWEILPAPRSYTRGLLKKYQRTLRAMQQQSNAYLIAQPHYRDPLMATCTDLVCTYNNSNFIHINSDDVIQPVWIHTNSLAESPIELTFN